MAHGVSEGAGSSGSARADSEQLVYDRIAERDEFVELQRHYRRFAFPATLAFMVWYVMYVVANNWARGFMDTPVVGNINVAIVWGLLQFVSTFGIAAYYSQHAAKTLDPLAEELCADFNKETGR